MPVPQLESLGETTVPKQLQDPEQQADKEPKLDAGSEPEPHKELDPERDAGSAVPSRTWSGCSACRDS